MTRLTMIVAGAAFLALIAAPAEGKDRHHRGHHGYGHSQQYYGYGPGYYGYSDYGYSRRYGRRHYRYRDDCDGTAGALIGGVAGALIGREIDRSGGRHYRYRRDGTTGLIVGGALGAVVGNEVARGC